MTSPPLRFELLGRLRVWRGDDELELGSTTQRALLARLLVSANQVVVPSQLLAAGWGGDPPPNGVTALHQHIAALRRLLEPDRAPRSPSQVISRVDGGYRLSVEPGQSDLDRFDAQVRSAVELRNAGQLDGAARHLRDALALWRSEPLEDGGPAFATERRRLLEHRVGVWEEYAELELELGRHESLEAELPGFLEAFPVRERLRGIQMQILYSSGRTEDALAVYREFSDRLLDEHGVEPGTELAELHKRIGLTSPGRIERHKWLEGDWPVSFADLVPAQRPLSSRLLLKLLALVLSVGTIGFGGPVGLAAVAIRRQRKLLGAVAVCCLVTWFVGLIVSAETDEGTVASDVGFGLWLGSGGLSTLYLVVIVAPKSTRRVRVLAGFERRRTAREQIARNVVPADNGGLINPNEATAEMLARIPGVTLLHAHVIVADREQHGPFKSLDDLDRRGLFPSPLPAMVAEFLIIP